MRSKILHITVGLLLAGAGLYIFFGGDGAALAALAGDLAGTSRNAALACAALTILPMWLRAVRLGVMLPDTEGAGRHKRGLFAVTTVSFMINNILPARAGEAARVYLLWKRNGYPVTVSIGALLLERALDVVVYLAFLFLPVFLSPPIAASLRGINPAVMIVIWGAFAAFAALITLFALYALAPEIFRRTLRRTARPFSEKTRARMGKIGAELESSLDWIFSPRKAAAVAALTILTALCYAAMLPILVAEWNLFGPLEAVFSQAFAAFGAAIPLAPGGVGTLHAVLLQGLTAMGVDDGKARAVTVVYHGVQYAIITGLGVIMLVAMGVKIKDITKKNLD